MKTKLMMLCLCTLYLSGCGETHMQRWYQASVVFEGSVRTITALGERGYISKETGKELLPIIEEADEALTELADIAITCDKYPEMCDEARSEWLWEKVDNALDLLERYMNEKIAEQGGGESTWQQLLRSLRL